MKNLKRIFAVIILSLLVNISFAGGDKGYKVKFKINGISDTIVYLGHHYGDKIFAVDTAKIDESGSGIFQGNKKLDGGIYIVIMPSINSKSFEIIIDKDQNFSLETD